MFHINWPYPLSYVFIAVDILIISFLLYKTMIYLFHSWTATILKGILIMAAVFFSAHLFQLKTLIWLFGHFLTFLPLALIIIFQQEIRRFLAHIGTPGLFTKMHENQNEEKSKKTIQQILSAFKTLSQRKIGALIVFEEEVDHKVIKEKAILLDSVVSEQLLISIFVPTTPLHDGAVIIRNNKVEVARAFLPITEKKTASYLGSRHRAAIGLSERSDALLLIVSEETGYISMSYKGVIFYNIGLEKLQEKIYEILQFS